MSLLRDISHSGKAAFKYPWKLWRCGLWLHLVTTRCQDPFLGEQEHSHAEEFGSDNERHVELQSPIDR
ncbi:hypothetical protein TNCV_2150131 [Trichonephila clavipes]|nr:hypothetical protein TNCV_2150131 [Trichonephila clavipes]